MKPAQNFVFRSTWARDLYARIPDDLAYNPVVVDDFVKRTRLDGFGSTPPDQEGFPLWRDGKSAVDQLGTSKSDTISRQKLKETLDRLGWYLWNYYERKTNDGPVTKAAEVFDKGTPVTPDEVGKTFLDAVKNCHALCSLLGGGSDVARQAFQKLKDTAWSYVEVIAVEHEAATLGNNTSPLDILRDARGLTPRIPAATPPQSTSPRTIYRRGPQIADSRGGAPRTDGQDIPTRDDPDQRRPYDLGHAAAIRPKKVDDPH